ncbi:SAM-dependent methyltransferase [Micromonospora sp. NPDC007230]|uniref:SAM-dependent methyltransferase n=1 Tax=Micromonospora sp. NPDC007230 TaxID=3364237 RepID=UPI0036C29A1A
MTTLDLPRSFTIREGDLRIINPFDAGKLATLGRAIKLEPGTSILDLCSGKGELLCTWARDHGVTGTGVDISTVNTAAARERAVELGVGDRVRFLHGDAATYVAAEPVDVAACVGATWIGDGVPGTLEILERSLRPGGMVLVGEPYWRLDPPDEEAVAGSHARSRDAFRDLPGLVRLFGECGWDLVEMVLADQDSWDRYAAAHWLNLRRWLDANPDDELAGELRRELTEDPLRYVRYQREYLGWGVFALLPR